MILTQRKNFETKVKVVYESWAHKCDAYKFIAVVNSNNYNESTEIDVNGVRILQPPRHMNDSYGMLTTKVLLTIEHVYDTYPNFDFYLKCDDDTFIFVDNLRWFLEDKNPAKAVSYGYDFAKFVDFGK